MKEQHNTSDSTRRTEIREPANISLSLVTGAIHYTEAEFTQKFCGTRFEYREGNKRIVLLVLCEGYVVKIAKMAGSFLNLRDNLMSQETCISCMKKVSMLNGDTPMAIATYSYMLRQGCSLYKSNIQRYWNLSPSR